MGLSDAQYLDTSPETDGEEIKRCTASRTHAPPARAPPAPLASWAAARRRGKRRGRLSARYAHAPFAGCRLLDSRFEREKLDGMRHLLAVRLRCPTPRARACAGAACSPPRPRPSRG